MLFLTNYEKEKKKRIKFSTYIQSSLYNICITRKPLVVENDSSRMSQREVYDTQNELSMLPRWNEPPPQLIREEDGEKGGGGGRVPNNFVAGFECFTKIPSCKWHKILTNKLPIPLKFLDITNPNFEPNWYKNLLPSEKSIICK